MAIPLVDLHLKFVVDHTIKTILSDPDRHLKEIFGDAKIEPHAALYGDRFINEAKKWITTTKIPVVLGFQLDPAQLPGVSIHLPRTVPAQSYMGDMAFTHEECLAPYEREILVPGFIPKKVEQVNDTATQITLPDNLSTDTIQLIAPGLRFRDKNQKEFAISIDRDAVLANELPNGTKLKDADFSKIEVISPIDKASYQDGAMLFDEQVLLTVHGHSDRIEGLWLWAIVHWGILKYRPLLTSIFGLDLAMPASADFSKDDSFLGENVWRRYISLSVKANHSWTQYRRQDAVAFILHVKGSMNDLFGSEETDNIT